MTTGCPEEMELSVERSPYFLWGILRLSWVYCDRKFVLTSTKVIVQSDGKVCIGLNSEVPQKNLEPNMTEYRSWLCSDPEDDEDDEDPEEKESSCDLIRFDRSKNHIFREEDEVTNPKWTLTIHYPILDYYPIPWR